jgi:hypothetical protein
MIKECIPLHCKLPSPQKYLQGSNITPSGCKLNMQQVKVTIKTLLKPTFNLFNKPACIFSGNSNFLTIFFSPMLTTKSYI